jgi:hypothetical protein
VYCVSNFLNRSSAQSGCAWRLVKDRRKLAVMIVFMERKLRVMVEI